MSVGASGRVVIEIDPDLKRELYQSLTREGKTMKDWFVENAQAFVNGQFQMPLEGHAGNAGAQGN